MAEPSADLIDTAGVRPKLLRLHRGIFFVFDSYKGNVFAVEPPNFVELKVEKTDPGFAGNTATNTLKPATLETGAEIKVPLFIEEGEVLKIDTRTGEYIGRA